MIDEPTRKNLRSFGMGLGALLGVAALLAWRKASSSASPLAGAGALSALTALACPQALKPIFRAWMKVTAVLAAVNTFVVTALMFYLLITPYALVSRLFGADFLDLRMGNGDSYWRPRSPRTDPGAYERQF